MAELECVVVESYMRILEVNSQLSKKPGRLTEQVS
jgi:hypothetical protein